MAKTCVFCGASGKMTGEHVFGDWLTRIGLNVEPLRHGVGRLNRSLRNIGVSRPFTRVVRDVCGTCNNGWMANLEGVASRVLPPMILGTPGSIVESDLAPLASWTHKTALVNMLMTEDAQQARGDHFLGRELRNLHEGRHRGQPVLQTQFWVGQYEGEDRLASAWVTPMVAYVEGLPVPDVPQAYVMTLVVGRVLLQGLRFTVPLLDFEVENTLAFGAMWPPRGPISWPAGGSVNDVQFLKVGKGLNLRPRDVRFVLAPWKPAVDLEESEAEGGLVRLPTPCGEHVVFYPGHLVAEAMRGVFYSFVTSCECGKRYLVVTEPDGAHFKGEDHEDPMSEAGVAGRYEQMEGDEFVVTNDGGDFVSKRLRLQNEPDHDTTHLPRSSR